MKNYKEPIIKVELLTTENVLTTSGNLPTNESLVMNKLDDAGVSTSKVTKLVFEEIINAQQ